LAWKNLKQLSLADSLTTEHEALTQLDDINELMDWEAIEHLLVISMQNVMATVHGPVFMFKALLLQSRYGLSDPKLERLLVRGLLFGRFEGLSLVDSVPNHSSIWRNRPNKDTDGNNTQDHEASWNVKQGSDRKRKSTYGFKAQANVDEDGFIKATRARTRAKTKAKKHDDWLKDQHVDNKVIVRAYRNTPLTPEQKKKNQRNSGTRCTVERVFGILKLHYGMGQARYLGRARNRIRFGVMCLAYNLRRG
jgi:IS5 family transposase